VGVSMHVAESTVSAQEKQARTERNQSVLGTLAMEGITLDPISMEIGRRFDQGEITLAEFSAAMQAHIANLASDLRRAQAAGQVSNQGQEVA
jgi:hypothetical protein